MALTPEDIANRLQRRGSVPNPAKTAEERRLVEQITGINELEKNMALLQTEQQLQQMQMAAQQAEMAGEQFAINKRAAERAAQQWRILLAKDLVTWGMEHALFSQGESVPALPKDLMDGCLRVLRDEFPNTDADYNAPSENPPGQNVEIYNRDEEVAEIVERHWGETQPARGGPVPCSDDEPPRVDVNALRAKADKLTHDSTPDVRTGFVEPSGS